MASSKGLPPIDTVEKGKRWFRVYWAGVRPTRFTDTPLHEPPWRFSPFLDSHTNKTVQALYMGDSAMCAMAETIFRKDIVGAVLPSQVDARHICQVSTQRDLNVAVLTDEFLKGKLGYNPIMTNDYARCRDVAIMLYHLPPTPLDGLVFPSYQTEGHNGNLVVFSTRVKSGDFRVVPKSKSQVYDKKYRLDFLLALDRSSRLLSDKLRVKIEKARS